MSGPPTREDSIVSLVEAIRKLTLAIDRSGIQVASDPIPKVSFPDWELVEASQELPARVSLESRTSRAVVLCCSQVVFGSGRSSRSGHQGLARRLLGLGCH